jgi:hypothetical protein
LQVLASSVANPKSVEERPQAKQQIPCGNDRKKKQQQKLPPECNFLCTLRIPTRNIWTERPVEKLLIAWIQCAAAISTG